LLRASGHTRYGAAVASVVVRLRGGLAALALAASVGCGDHGLLPTTVDKGGDFNVAEVVFDEGYFYCTVEPMLFGQNCGPGDGGADGTNGCHFSVTSFRLTNYGPPFTADGCTSEAAIGQPPSQQSKQNYTVSQAKMDTDFNLAQLLLRPTGKAPHPRPIFATGDPPADIIREWSTRFTTQ
jgi:hypothetical protein